MLLWAYHSLSCNGVIANCLSNIGFDISRSQMGTVQINPFNKRKWAWIVSGVTKPIKKEIVDKKDAKEGKTG